MWTARFSFIFFMGQLYFSVQTIGKAILDIEIVLHGSLSVSRCSIFDTLHCIPLSYRLVIEKLSARINPRIKIVAKSAVISNFDRSFDRWTFIV